MPPSARVKKPRMVAFPHYEDHRRSRSIPWCSPAIKNVAATFADVAIGARGGNFPFLVKRDTIAKS